MPVLLEYRGLSDMDQQIVSVLIVDDSAFVRGILDELLRLDNYRVLTASSGPEALSMTAQEEPDLILLDTLMPGMSGFEVCQILRADPKTSEIPVILVVEAQNRAARLKGIQAGADDFISKPVQPDELRARIRLITRLNRYRRQNQEQARLETENRQLQETYELTLESWARSLELYGREAEGHTHRVMDLCSRLAERLGVKDQEVLKEMRRGALLHDIGKVNIPDSIMFKPGALDPAEWEVIRLHPLHAYDMIYPIEYLRHAVTIPYYHHEKWDGSGYPHGLKGEKIPLSARIFAIIDVWDSLSCDRPYRHALTRDEVIQHIKNQSGKHFDPHIAEVFLTMVEEGAL